MKKICVVVHSLAFGGAERSNMLVAEMLSEAGYQTTIFSITDHIDLSSGVPLVTVPELSKSFFFKKFKIDKAYRVFSFFRSQKFDLIIDGRSRPSFLKELVFQKIIFRNTTTIGLVRSAHLPIYFCSNSWQNRFLYRNTQLVCVSKGIVNKIKKQIGLSKVMNIYNAFDIPEGIKASLNDNRYVLFFGRIEQASKNLTFLIDHYVRSRLPVLDIKLLILGSGPDVTMMKAYAAQTKYKDLIQFIDFVDHPLQYAKNAIYTIMTSYYEGFPRAIVESLSVGTPVVSLDFESGPSELIKTGFNGILVPLSQKSNFYKSLDKMIEEPDFYAKCKQGTRTSIEHLTKEEISRQWERLIKSIK